MGNYTQTHNVLISATNFLTSISIASVLQSVVIFAFIMTMSHFSSENEYSEYRKIFYIIDFTTAISMFGSGALILRKPIKEIYNNIISIVLIINSIQLIAVLVFMFIQHFTFIKYIEIIFFIALNTTYHIVISIIVLRNARKLYFACTSTCFVFTGISLFFLVKSDALTFTFAYLIRLIILLIYVVPFLIWIGKRLFKIKFPTFQRTLSLFKEAAPIGFGTIIGSFTLYIDKFIASMMDAHQLAVYANASADVPFVGTAIATMSSFFLPIIHNCYIKRDIKGACSNLSELLLYGWYIGVTVFTILFCNAEYVVELLYSKQYMESVVLFRIFCLAYLFRIVTYSSVIVALELENIIIKRMIIEMILQTVLSVLLLKILGPLGLAISVITVLALWSVPYNVWNFKRRLNCKLKDIYQAKRMLVFFLKAFLPCLLIVAVMSVLGISQLIVLISSIVVYVLINFRELLYIIRKTR